MKKTHRNDEEITDRPEKKVKVTEDDNHVTPWASKKTLQIKSTQLRLHNEIVEFYLYISPSDEEHQIRENTFIKIKKFLYEFVPNAKIESFGSFKTKLYLPNSDMDIACIDESISQKTLYSKVAKALLANKEDYEQVNLITNAKVPIIKFVDVETQLNFDLSFNKQDGIKQIEEVTKAFSIYPEAKYIIYILKCMLRQRDLHETYQGGIGSFLLFCMVIAFLREFRRDHHKQNANLSAEKQQSLQEVLLSEYILKILDFFGSRFDISRKRIVMIDGGRIVDKPTTDERLSLISPQDQDHDIGHSAYKIREICQIFKNRYNFLTHYNFQQNESLLKYLLNPSSSVFTFLR